MCNLGKQQAKLNRVSWCQTSPRYIKPCFSEEHRISYAASVEAHSDVRLDECLFQTLQKPVVESALEIDLRRNSFSCCPSAYSPAVMQAAGLIAPAGSSAIAVLPSPPSPLQ